MNFNVIKLLLLCLALTLSTGCSLVYKEKQINKSTTKITKKVHSSEKIVRADIISLRSLTSQLKTTKEMNQPAQELLKQELPVLIKLHSSIKEKIASINRSLSKIRSLVKGHKEILTDSPLGEEINQKQESVEQDLEQLNEINEQYYNQREALGNSLTKYEVRQVDLASSQKKMLKKLRKSKNKIVKKQKGMLKYKQKKLKSKGDLMPEQRAKIENKTKQINAIIDIAINKVTSVDKKYNTLLKKYKNKKSTWMFPKNDIYDFMLFMEKTKSEFTEIQNQLNSEVKEWNQILNSF